MNKLDISNWGGWAEILGIAICVLGETFMTIFKGLVIFGHHILQSDSSWLDLGGFSPRRWCLRMVSLFYLIERERESFNVFKVDHVVLR